MNLNRAVHGAGSLSNTGSRMTQAFAPVSLAGTWRFRLDAEDAGVAAAWFSTRLPASISLPGSLPEQGVGDPVTLATPWVGRIIDQSYFTAPEFEAYRQPGNIKVPFWLTPDTYYAGTAWFQQDMELPEAWAGRRVVLSMERPHWETRVWVDSQFKGADHSLGTAHEHDLGVLAPGKHTLTIRVDNRVIVDVGENSHSISDHTQGNWNGIVGRIELRSTPPVWIDEVQVIPRRNEGNAKVVVRVGNLTGRAGAGTLMAQMVNQTSPEADKPASPLLVPVRWDRTEGGVEFECAPQSHLLWDEFTPQLYRLELQLVDPESSVRGQDSRAVTFGFREIATEGTRFTINGRATFLRGTLESCIFPKTGYPPTDGAEWRRLIGIAKAHGLNLIRFHSWCPPEEAFVAADELGFYFHVEASSWASVSTTLGDGKPVDQWLAEETGRILKAYGNHPSFILMAYGNEPSGEKQNAYLAKWVDHYKGLDPRHLFTSAGGWPELANNQWHCVPGPRIQGWGEGLKSIINAKPPETAFDFRDFIQKRAVPVVSHEVGQWCAYPNFDEMGKYTGYLKPKNFEIFRDRLAARGLLDQSRAFLMASGKLQALCYKADIEAALRTPGMGGFELLDLHDFPGQGTALVGVLDPFWEEKGYITPAEYSHFCNETVPLARLPKRVFTLDETLEADIEVAHFGARPLVAAVVEWALTGSDGKPVATGTLPARTLLVGNGVTLGHVSIKLGEVPVAAPARYRLVVGIRGTTFANDWDVWVYPAAKSTSAPMGVTLAHDLDAATLAVLRGGGKVLLLVPPSHVKNVENKEVKLGFSSIFWNTAWTKRQAPTTLGILCDPANPAFTHFPTESHSNWQWWYLVTRAAPMILDALPQAVRPTVQVIDDWVTAHKLALVFEAQVEGGRLMVCSIDLENELAENPVARQLRTSLLAYMAGPAFNPGVRLTPGEIASLISVTSAVATGKGGEQVS